MLVCVPNDPQPDSAEQSTKSSLTSRPVILPTTFYADLVTLSAQTGTVAASVLSNEIMVPLDALHLPLPPPPVTLSEMESSPAMAILKQAGLEAVVMVHPSAESSSHTVMSCRTGPDGMWLPLNVLPSECSEDVTREGVLEDPNGGNDGPVPAAIDSNEPSVSGAIPEAGGGLSALSECSYQAVLVGSRSRLRTNEALRTSEASLYLFAHGDSSAAPAAVLVLTPSATVELKQCRCTKCGDDSDVAQATTLSQRVLLVTPSAASPWAWHLSVPASVDTAGTGWTLLNDWSMCISSVVNNLQAAHALSLKPPPLAISTSSSSSFNSPALLSSYGRSKTCISRSSACPPHLKIRSTSPHSATSARINTLYSPISPSPRSLKSIAYSDSEFHRYRQRVPFSPPPQFRPSSSSPTESRESSRANAQSTTPTPPSIAYSVPTSPTAGSEFKLDTFPSLAAASPVDAVTPSDYDGTASSRFHPSPIPYVSVPDREGHYSVTPPTTIASSIQQHAPLSLVTLVRSGSIQEGSRRNAGTGGIQRASPSIDLVRTAAMNNAAAAAAFSSSTSIISVSSSLNSSVRTGKENITAGGVSLTRTGSISSSSTRKSQEQHQQRGRRISILPAFISNIGSAVAKMKRSRTVTR
ncbi:hypothetical protein HDU78_000570 [Chytriomyces hyalinus]|nr:hypothetical protein HDU78_000570 [Chytriomyces hyalinus]